MKPIVSRVFLGTAILAAASLSWAQIERLDLPSMVAKSDNAVHAEITSRRVFRVDHPVDGPELYFTTIHLQGRSLRDGTAIGVDLTYPGGFIDEKHGVHNSEAPSVEDTRPGNTVVAFYRWTDNMGGEVRGNVPLTWHGGIYRTADGPKGTVVLGRGDGYAVDKNIALGDLEKAVRALAEKR